MLAVPPPGHGGGLTAAAILAHRWQGIRPAGRCRTGMRGSGLRRGDRRGICKGSTRLRQRVNERQERGQEGRDQGALGARRRLLLATSGGAATLLLAGCAPPLGSPRAAADNPFTLGVASGYPTADGFVLWTRLVPDAARPPTRASSGTAGVANHGTDLPPLPEAVPVAWEIADDEGMRRIVSQGQVEAAAAAAHSVHVEVAGLASDRWYWYRFTALGHRSRVGRTRTLPQADAAVARLRLAVASCQNIEHGYFAAYRHIVADQPDLIVHLGDYVYEGTWGQNLVRPLRLGEAQTLAEYRQRHAIYKRDPDLQEAHAMFPWVMVWDDHEVANDYADASPERLLPPAMFLKRRAAGYQAYYEHMPMPARMAPQGAAMRIHTAVRFGNLATLDLLDTRQYRAPQACPPPGRGGGNWVVPSACEALRDPARSMLGVDQERWLEREFAAASSRWNLVGQQTLVAPMQMPRDDGAAARSRTDGWDGYPLSRQRLLDAMVAHRLRNPVVLGGDLHAFHAADLHAKPEDPAAAIVATEFVATSITSQSPGQDHFERVRSANPHIRHADGRRRGYLRLTLSKDRLHADLMALDDVGRADSGIGRQATFVVEAGRPGAQRD
jgi:alkaline phosphatase D